MKIDTDEVIEAAREKGWPVADKAKVKKLVDGAMAGINAELAKDEFAAVDIFMVISNLARVICEQIEGDRKPEEQTLENKRLFRQLMVDTVARGLLTRLMN